MRYRFEALQVDGVVLRFQCDPGFSFLSLAQMLESNPEIKSFTVFEGKSPYTGSDALVYVCPKYVYGKVWDKVLAAG